MPLQIWEGFMVLKSMRWWDTQRSYLCLLWVARGTWAMEPLNRGRGV